MAHLFSEANNTAQNNIGRELERLSVAFLIPQYSYCATCSFLNGIPTSGDALMAKDLQLLSSLLVYWRTMDHMNTHGERMCIAELLLKMMFNLCWLYL